jgi:hypothetical protein
MSFVTFGAALEPGFGGMIFLSGKRNGKSCQE